MKSLPRFALLLVLALCTLPLLAEEATFDRTLKVADGPVDLEVVTGSGSIAVRSGAPGAITIHGTVRENCCNLFGGAEAGAVKTIASNPPIEQTGNTVRIGHLGESQRYNRIRCAIINRHCDERRDHHNPDNGDFVGGSHGALNLISACLPLAFLQMEF